MGSSPAILLGLGTSAAKPYLLMEPSNLLISRDFASRRALRLFVREGIKAKPAYDGPSTLCLAFSTLAEVTQHTQSEYRSAIGEARSVLSKLCLAPHCRFSFFGSMMKRMSFSETIFLFLLALIIFGPKKLPEIARQVGKYMNEFKRASNEFKAQIEQEISNLEVDKRDVEKRQTILPPSPPPQGATSRTPHALSGEADAADSSAVETRPGEVPATEATAPQAPSDDEPLFATNAAAGTAAVAPNPAVASSDHVASPTTQESHV